MHATYARARKNVFHRTKVPREPQSPLGIFSFDKHGNGKYVSPHNKGYGGFVCAHFGGGEGN